MKFKSYYRTKPKVPLEPASQPTEMRPPALPRTGSIKINTAKASGSPRTALPTSAIPETEIAVSTPKRPANGTPLQAVQAADTPTAAPKRPLADKEENAPPAAKRPKMQPKAPSSESGMPKRRRIVTFKTKDPKRLGMILGLPPPPPAPLGRTALPSKLPKDPSPGAANDTITAKPVRKPLPSGDSGRKPLPGSGPSSSPPARPAATPLTVDTNMSPAPGSQAGSPTPASAASGVRKKIKIVRKPTPQQPPPSAP